MPMERRELAQAGMDSVDGHGAWSGRLGRHILPVLILQICEPKGAVPGHLERQVRVWGTDLPH